MSTTEASVEVPALEGEPSLTSLEALKNKLSDALESQKAMLAELKAKGEQCTKDLEAARAEAKAAAEAEAAAAAQAAAKQEAASKKKATKKPTAVKKAEEQGTPTKGVRSRY